MALVLEIAPPSSYPSVNSDMVYIIYESVKAIDPVTYIDYRYVADIYISGVKVSSLKSRPHPVTKRGIFNIAPVVRNYINFIFTPTSNVLFAQGFANGTFWASIEIKYGEEYGGTLYTNVYTPGGFLAFNHYNGRLIGSNTTRLPLQLGDSLIGTYSLLELFTNKIASTRPTKGSKVELNSINYFVSIFTLSAGLYGPTITSVGSYGTMSITPTYTAPDNFCMNVLNLSPSVLNALHAGFINEGTEYYVIEFFASNIRVDVYCEHRYDTNPIHFLSETGGVETFEFSKLSVSKIDMQSKSIGLSKSSYVDGTTSVGIVNNPTFNTYATSYTEKIILNSDNLSQDMYKYLAQMLVSPKKWLEVDGQLYPIKFTGTSYELKPDARDKARKQLQVECDFAEDINTQYF